MSYDEVLKELDLTEADVEGMRMLDTAMTLSKQRMDAASSATACATAVQGEAVTNTTANQQAEADEIDLSLCPTFRDALMISEKGSNVCKIESLAPANSPQIGPATIKMTQVCACIDCVIHRDTTKEFVVCF